MNPRYKRWLRWIVWGVILAAVGVFLWQRFRPKAKLEGLATGNGRIEATEINIASKFAGRLKELRVNEGDFVSAGQVVGQMDTDVLEAQRREAEAQLQQALKGVAAARSRVDQRESDKAAAIAVVKQRQSEHEAASKRAARTLYLTARGVTSQQDADDDRTRADGAFAAIGAAEAQVAAAEAAVISGLAEIENAQYVVEAAKATIQRIQADISDSALKAPRDGRVQFRVAEVGEVLASGGRVVNMLDLNDVYMTIFLPTAAAGRVALGGEARVILDAAPQYVIPAYVSFVADQAQFTPKTVETQSEREKLMFRMKTQIPKDVLKTHIRWVKSGLPGVAYVKLDPNVQWPPHLQINLPKE